MFLTKECDYAIRVVRCLADMEIKSVGTICEREYVPRPFAYKILKKLERSGIVTAYRGNAGGYQLAKSPKQITILDVIRAVDERLFVNECLNAEYVCPHNNNGKGCGVHREFCRVQDVLMKVLEQKSIQELL